MTEPRTTLGRLLTALLLAATALGCAHVPPEPPEPPEPPQAEEACEAFCELYVTLQCDTSADTPGQDGIDGTADDEPCAVACRDNVTQGQFAPDRACLDRAATCEAAEECIFGPADAPEMGP